MSEKKTIIKDKEAAIKYCLNKGCNMQEATKIVNDAIDYCDEELLLEEYNYFFEWKEWKKRPLWKKIVYTEHKGYRDWIVPALGVVGVVIMTYILSFFVDK